ncbi:MAG: hypothetical protein D6730_21870 [Bacteroidetes bacterium]|nr:MAG: hypothetical protein D6730_21870 [Bacteroidota bacterium]
MKPFPPLYLLWGLLLPVAGLCQPQFPGQQPDLFRYFHEEKSMLKIDLLNLVYQFGREGISGNVNLGYEHKLGTALSIDATLSTSYQLRFAPTPAQQVFSLPNQNIGLAIGPRLYYNLKKRIGQGKSADNLSANYITVQAITQLIFFRQNPRIVDEQGVYFFHGFSFMPMYGVQRRLGKRGFIDFGIGLRFFNGENDEAGLLIRTPDEMKWKPSPTTRLRLGIAF